MSTQPSRRKLIAKCLAEHGPMSIQGIRVHIPEITVNDLYHLSKGKFIKQVDSTKSILDSKAVVVYAVTDEGIEYSGAPGRQLTAAPPEPKPKVKRVYKPKPKRVEIIITKAAKAAKATTKLVPKPDVEITVTESTKFTTYEPKFTVTPYIPPKNFMECIR